jgi:hypothetical protein
MLTQEQLPFTKMGQAKEPHSQELQAHLSPASVVALPGDSWLA